MNKKLLLLPTIAIIVGCVSKPIERPKLPNIQYSHPDHGIVSLPHNAHKSDRNQCKSNTFKKGAVIDGQHVTDPQILKKYNMDALFYSMRSSEMSLRRKLADVGGTPLSQQKLNHDPTKNDEYYAEANRMENEINNCMDNLGWKKIAE